MQSNQLNDVISMKYISILIWFVIFFVAFFLKGYTVGDQELVYLWKIPLLIFMLVGVVGQDIRYAFLVVAYVFAIKNLITVSFFNYPMDAIVNFIKYLTIPVAIHWIYLNVNSVNALKKLRMVPVYMAVFFIFSNVPYYLGLISTQVSTTMLWMEDTQLDGLIGILGAPHYTSVMLAVACVVILEFIVKKRAEFHWNLLLIPIMLLGLFFLYKTYTRTGWLMFVVGVTVLFARKIRFKDLGKIVVAGMVVLGGLVFMFQTDEGFRRRIMDQRAGEEHKSAYETVGSGRLRIAEVYMENLFESRFMTILLGMGMEESMLQYEKKEGARLFAHNGFIQTIVDNGILGFLIYILLLVLIYKELKKSRSSYNQLAVALFFMFISCLATQQANYFLLDVFLSIYIGLAIIENRVNEYVAYKRRPKTNILLSKSY